MLLLKCCKLDSQNRGGKNLILVAFGALLTMAATMSDRYLDTFHIIEILGIGQFRYFIYFILGVIVRKGITLKHVELWMTACVVGVFLLNMSESGCAQLIGTILNTFLLYGSTLAVTYVAFKKYAFLSNDSIIGRSLCFMGRRALDIYFIHYFFIPRDLDFIGQWFTAHYAPLLMLVLALVIALLVIISSLAVGGIIRLSPTMSKYLLGGK